MRTSRTWEDFERAYLQEWTAEAERILREASDAELAAWARRFPNAEVVQAEQRRRLERPPVGPDEP